MSETCPRVILTSPRTGSDFDLTKQIQVLLLLLHRTNNKSLPGLKSVVSSSFDKKVTEYKGFEQFGALPAVLLDSKASYVVQSYIKVRETPV